MDASVRGEYQLVFTSYVFGGEYRLLFYMWPKCCNVIGQWEVNTSLYSPPQEIWGEYSWYSPLTQNKMDTSVRGEYQLYSPLSDASILFNVLILFANRIKMSPGPLEVNTRIYSPLMKLCIHIGLKASVNTSFHAQGSKFLYSPPKVLVTL